MSEEREPPTSDGAREPTGLPGSDLVWRAASLVGLGTGAFLLASGRGTVSGAILLLVVGLAASGVLLGRGPFGPATEGPNDLSARLGLGLLGGLLGGLTIVVVRWPLEGLGIPEALGVTLPEVWAGSALLSHAGAATLWGMVLGLIYPHIPGVSPSSRGIRFSLLISLYMLLKAYPFDLDLGWFGSGLGALAWLFVLVLNAVWGAVAGSAIGWGEIADEAPVARPIDA